MAMRALITVGLTLLVAATASAESGSYSRDIASSTITLAQASTPRSQGYNFGHVFDKDVMKDFQEIDMDDPAEVQMAFLMCGLEGFKGSDCQKVLKFCIKQKLLWEEALSSKPWLCEDMRFIKEFL